MSKKKDDAKKDMLELFLEHDIDFKNRVIHVGGVGQTAALEIIKAIQWMEYEDVKKKIVFVINSYGGYVYEGLGIYDAIKNCKCPTETMGIGKVMSMGTFLMCAGKKRIAHKNTTFMFHELAGGSYGKYTEMKSDQKENDRLMQLFAGIYADNSKKSKKWWLKHLEHTDKYKTAQEVKELGMLDKVL